MAGLENALSEIQRLCDTGDPLPAHQHPYYARYLEQDWWDESPDVIIGRRRTITNFLGSGALYTLLIDDTEIGADMDTVQRHDEMPVLGSIVLEVMAARPFTFRNYYYNQQQTMLGLYIHKDRMLGGQPGGTLPFDEQMEIDTRDAWAEWGMKLHYQITAKGGTYAFKPLEDFEDIIATKLAGLD